MRDEPITDFDRRDSWNWKSEKLPQPRGQHFIREHANVLRVVLLC
jgi:hypothetical protein